MHFEGFLQEFADDFSFGYVSSLRFPPTQRKARNRLGLIIEDIIALSGDGPGRAFNRSFVRSFRGADVQTFMRGFVQGFNRSVVHSFKCAFVRLFRCSLVQAIIRATSHRYVLRGIDRLIEDRGRDDWRSSSSRNAGEKRAIGKSRLFHRWLTSFAKAL